MTEEEKLLVKDLSARLPYGVKINFTDPSNERDVVEKLRDVEFRGEDVLLSTTTWNNVKIDECKPYLRPMSSMTEEEKKEFIHCAEYEVEESVNGRHYEYYLKDYVGSVENPYCNYNSIDWLNKHHFDYRELIEMGLALPAPEGMY